MFNGGVAAKLSHRTAVSCADNQDVSNAWIGCHWNVCNHFVIDIFILFGQHQQTIQCHNTSELDRFKNVNALKIALHTGKLAVNPKGKPDVVCMIFGIPDIHKQTPFFFKLVPRKGMPAMGIGARIL